MSEAFHSFLISVSIIAGIALFVPCLEFLVRRLRRSPHSRDVSDESQWDWDERKQEERKQDERSRERLPKNKGAKEYSRKTA